MSAQADADLALITSAAKRAGEQALAMRAAGLTTTAKSDGTPVTDADLAVDDLLRTELGKARPDYGWLSEETADDLERLSRRRLFLVDPIDGTRAYVHGHAWWTISIAVVDRGRPVAGVVHAPDLGDTYRAIKGVGAWLNDRPIHPKPTAAVEGCGLLGDRKMFSHPIWSNPWPEMRVENRNSIAYRLCLVAEGAFDAALAMSSKNEWDLAAADLIATEAGCLVTDHRGRGFRYNRPVPQAPSLVCAGPALHALILRRVAPIELPNS
jgi:myo-inositol-1(or 4)-monophosphatase